MRPKTTANSADLVAVHPPPERGDAALQSRDRRWAVLTGPLLHDGPDGVVQGVEIRTVRRPFLRRPKIDAFFLEKILSFFCPVGRGRVLLENEGHISSVLRHLPHPGDKGVPQGINIAIGPQPEALRKPYWSCLLYTSPSPRDRQKSRMPSSA